MLFRKRKIIKFKRFPDKTRADYLKKREVARKFVLNKLAAFGPLYMFEYGRVSIKNQKTVWGSCSEKKNLNFNYRIIYLPEDLAEYIIVHELCHLKELNHSANFWNLVSITKPDYKNLRKRLRNYRIKIQ
jgi:predicted metal-dependent hydrolase